MKKLLADIELAPEGGFKGFGPLGEFEPEAAGATFAKFISSVIGIITVVGAIWFVFVFIFGAIAMISAGGDKQQLESAKKKITTGIIGITVTVAAIFLIRLITRLIGIPDILDIEKMIPLIAPK